ncbi:MAG: hypothetical protein LBQ60_21180 [Bacteroidales bacterium]|jgi:Leucine-rich repeat (LRR) protein|nr:hypothetical protein [Bacteroidales bacterium]
MKKYLYAIFCLVLVLSSCKKEEDPDLSEESSLKSARISGQLLVEMRTSISTVTIQELFLHTGHSSVTIDWGDGIVEETGTIHPTAKTHTYSSSGRHTIKIYGDPESLDKIRVTDNILSYLDLSNNKKLSMIQCQRNVLYEIKLPVNSPLKYLYCYENILFSLDLDSFTELISLACDDNQIEELTLTNCTRLETLSCSHNNLNHVFMAQDMPFLEIISCENNYLYSSIIPDNAPNLKYVNTTHAYSNILFYLDMTSLPVRSGSEPGDYKAAIDYVHYPELAGALSNHMQDINWRLENFYRLPKIEIQTPYCSSVELETEDVFRIEWGDKHIDKDLSNGGHQYDSPGIYTINIYRDIFYPENKLTYLKATGMPIVQFNEAQELEEVNISCTGVKERCLMSTLDVSGLFSLNTLNCEYRKITQLKLPDRVEIVNCKYCDLTELNVSNCLRLKYLDCTGTQITRLTLPSIASNCDIKLIYLAYAPILENSAAMISLANSLPNRTGGDLGGLFIQRDRYNSIQSWIGNICAQKNWHLIII